MQMTNFSFRKSIFGGNEVETKIKVEVARKSSNFEEKKWFNAIEFAPLKMTRLVDPVLSDVLNPESVSLVVCDPSMSELRAT